MGVCVTPEGPGFWPALSQITEHNPVAKHPTQERDFLLGHMGTFPFGTQAELGCVAVCLCRDGLGCSSQQSLFMEEDGGCWELVV